MNTLEDSMFFSFVSLKTKRYIFFRLFNCFILTAVTFTGSMNLNAKQEEKNKIVSSTEKYEKAIFAGGCFWCMEPPFDTLEGVLLTTSGYIGGAKENPTYEEISTGQTGHAEAVEVLYDPIKVTYTELLRVFWENIDPTTPNRQFADIGTQYRSAIFYHNEEQKKLAEASKAELGMSGKYDAPIITEIAPASSFYKAEEYHQNYYQKNPHRYERYKYGSGRADYIKKMKNKE